jgi:hypothetical protein
LPAQHPNTTGKQQSNGEARSMPARGPVAHCLDRPKSHDRTLCV